MLRYCLYSPIQLISSLDLFHEKCLLAFCAKQLSSKQDKLEGLKLLRCPTCKLPVIIETSQPSLLREAYKGMFSKSEWGGIVELLLPSTNQLKKQSSQEGPIDYSTFTRNEIQPNQRTSSYTIDMPTTGYAYEWKKWYFQQRDGETKRLSFAVLGRLLLNTITLRNARCFSRGISPRHLIFVLFLMTIGTVIFVKVF